MGAQLTARGAQEAAKRDAKHDSQGRRATGPRLRPSQRPSSCRPRNGVERCGGDAATWRPATPSGAEGRPPRRAGCPADAHP